jgi:hypothetical protein
VATTALARAVESSQFEANFAVRIGTSSVWPSMRMPFDVGRTAAAMRSIICRASLDMSELPTANAASSGSETIRPRLSRRMATRSSFSDSARSFARRSGSPSAAARSATMVTGGTTTGSWACVDDIGGASNACRSEYESGVIFCVSSVEAA